MLLVNVGIVITLSIVLSLLGVRPYMNSYGLDYEQLAIFCLVWGMGGAFMSLLLSKFIAKMALGVKVLDPNSHPDARKVHEMVRRASERAGLSKMPELGVYQSPEINAFATGPSRRHSLVAVSTGLLSNMDDDAIEGVLGHEVAHIANGDMVTMTLIQGVMNALVMFVSRIVAHAVSSNQKGERSSSGLYFVTLIACELVLGLFGVMVTSWFSRHREFRADAGSARFTSRDKMIRALQALESRAQGMDPRAPGLATFKISGKRGRGFLSLISTHPPLSERIEALQRGRFSGNS